MVARSVGKPAVVGAADLTVTGAGRPRCLARPAACGHEIGQLVPLRRQRQFVSRAEFAATSHTAASFDLDAFRQDQMMAQEDEITDRHGD